MPGLWIRGKAPISIRCSFVMAEWCPPLLLQPKQSPTTGNSDRLVPGTRRPNYPALPDHTEPLPGTTHPNPPAENTANDTHGKAIAQLRKDSTWMQTLLLHKGESRESSCMGHPVPSQPLARFLVRRRRYRTMIGLGIFLVPSPSSCGSLSQNMVLFTTKIGGRQLQT